MNERIRELAEQCGYWSGQTIEMNDVGIEKFAELIVKECLDIVKDNIDSGTAFYEIVDRFGVEL